MAKDKERSVNPAQQARKQEKNRALKKAKNEQQARRNEKLARRNPDRLQRQVDDLKALESSGQIKPREKAILADLERDLRAVKKARDALGEKATTFGNAQPRRDRENTGGDDRKRGDGQGVLGKRGRDGERRFNHRHNNDRDNSDTGEETDDVVRNIPMPRDTPPPIPAEFRNKHRHNQRYHQQQQQEATSDSRPGQLSTPSVEQKTTYSSAPQIRDLRKEATSRFVPSAVKIKQNAVKGVGGALLEPEELDRLEAVGYSTQKNKSNPSEREKDEDDDEDDDAEATRRRLADEEARFQQELADVDSDGGGGGGGGMDIDSPPSHPIPPQSQSQSQTTLLPRSYQVEIEEVDDEDL